MKFVVVSKAFVRDAYQRKLEEIGRHGSVDLTLISPPSWREGGTTLQLNPRFTRGYELLVTPIVFNGRFHVHFYPRLPRLLRTLRPDVVHVDEEPYNLATWLALRAARSVGARCLVFTWQNLRRSLPVPFSTMESWNFRLAHGAIAGNQDAEGVLRAKGFSGPVWVIPQFGIDPELFKPVERLAKELSGSDTSDAWYAPRGWTCSCVPARDWTIRGRSFSSAMAKSAPRSRSRVRRWGLASVSSFLARWDPPTFPA